MPKHPQASYLVLALTSLTLLLLYLTLIRHSCSLLPQTAKHRPSSHECGHWIELSTTKKTAVLCLKGNKIKILMQALKRMEPGCSTQKPLVIPGHGKGLRVVRSVSASCAFKEQKMSARKRIVLGIPIGLNTASVGELSFVPGLGSRLAKRLVHYRDKHGPFASLDSITAVRGIGQKTMEKIRPYIFIQQQDPPKKK